MQRFQRRKWGWYLVLLKGRNFKIKLLYFKRDGEISLQRHEHRNETWCFLRGSGWMKNVPRTIVGSNVVSSAHPKRKGDYEYIPQGHWHHYKASAPTYVLEVQTGICKEEDIERV